MAQPVSPNAISGIGVLGEAAPFRYLTRMPPRRSSRFWASADINAVIAQVTPDVLALLGDGVPRSEAAIIAALAGRHSKDNVRRTVMRLAVLGQLAMQGSRYSLPAPGPAQG